MRNLIFFLFALRCIGGEYSIVFVHIGPTLPPYLKDALSQAALFNPNTPIYLIANAAALIHFSDPSVSPIPCEILPKSESHIKYLRERTTSGFWNHVVERFFYLEEFMAHFAISYVFHLENDVMLYRDLEELFPIFQKNYQGMIGATFDNDSRCIPGFIYIDTANPLSEFVKFSALYASRGDNDMVLYGMFRNLFYKTWIDHLPITLPSYSQFYSLETAEGATIKRGSDYSNHFEAFASIFDAAAFGQYIGGIDPIHGNSSPGFINESCIFNPARFSIHWEKDTKGRSVPYASFQGDSFPINNLHIHCKNLAAFSSLNDNLPNFELTSPLEKTNFPLSADSIDVVIVATEKNRSTLDQTIQSLRLQNKDIGRIIVVSPEPLSLDAEWFDEKLFPFSRSLIIDEIFTFDRFEKRRYPFHPHNQLQQIFAHLVYFYAPLVIPGLSQNVLALEPNVFFLNSIDFMTSIGEPLFNVKSKIIQPHKTLVSHLFPALQNYYEISHFVLLQKPILEDLFSQLKEEPWKQICRSLDHSKLYESSFSALTLYGSYAIERTEQAKLEPLKCKAALHFHDSLKSQQEGCHLIYMSR